MVTETIHNGMQIKLNRLLEIKKVSIGSEKMLGDPLCIQGEKKE